MTDFIFTDHTIDESIEASLMTKDINKKTAINYRSFANVLKRTLPTDHLPTDHMEVYAWLKVLRNLELSDETISSYFKKLKAIYRSLHRNFNAEWFIEKVDPPKVHKKDRRIFTNDETYLILTACNNDFERGLISVLIDSTCRIGELTTLTKQGIDVNKGLIRHIGKDKQSLTHRLDPQICQAILNLCPSTTDYIFSLTGNDTPYGSDEAIKNTNNLSHMVTRIIKRAGITGDKLGAHTLRHVSISNLTLKYGKERDVMKFTGHLSEKAVSGYMHELEKEEIITSYSPLKDIVEKSTLANNDRSVSAQNEFTVVETDDGDIIEYLPAVVDPIDKPSHVNQDRLNYYYNIEQNLPKLEKPIRPKLSPEDFEIIKQSIMIALKSGTMSVYSGQAIQLLQRMTRKVS